MEDEGSHKWRKKGVTNLGRRKLQMEEEGNHKWGKKEVKMRQEERKDERDSLKWERGDF